MTDENQPIKYLDAADIRAFLDLLDDKGVDLLKGMLQTRRADKISAVRAELEKHADLWQPRYEAFVRGEYTPLSNQDWRGLASVMPLADPTAYSSVEERVNALKAILAERPKGAGNEGIAEQTGPTKGPQK